MSDRYPGGLIRKTPPTITPPVDGEGGSAPGIWTLEQASYYEGTGEWPKPVLPRVLYGWGNNAAGQIGDNTTINKSSPVQVGSTSDNYYIAAVGGTTTNTATHAIRNDNTLWAFGQNASGQLGFNNLTPTSSPTQVGALSNWSSVSNGNIFSTAVKTDGTLWAWGLNNLGQLGNNDTGNPYIEVSSPIQIGALSTWLTTSSGAYFTLALKTGGTLWSWGRNNNGQLGHNDVTYRSSPTQIGALTTWAFIKGGFAHSFAVKTDGTLWAWGRTELGCLGNNSTSPSQVNSPIQIGALTNWLKMSAGDATSQAIKTDGTLWTWGNNNEGSVGNNAAPASISSPIQIGSDFWNAVNSGRRTTAAIRSDGTLWAWGRSSSGEVPNEAAVEVSSPVQIGSLTNWETLAGGSLATTLFGISKG